jgi:acyl transferase domain-containing protein
VFSQVQAQREVGGAFLLPGQGSQYVQMGRGLYEGEPTFRAHLDRCAALLQPHLGCDLRAVLYPDERQGDKETRRQGDDESGTQNSKRPEGTRTQNFSSILDLDQIWLAQPALFVIEYALAQLWMEWGIRPQALIGDSLGEYVAACLAGVLTLEEALFLVARRARMIHELPEGAMLAVSLPENDIHRWLGPCLSLAAVNGPSLCVVAGPTDVIADLAQQLTERRLVCRRLQTTHAVHSTMMAPIAERFAELVKTIDLKPPHIPYISNVTGTWITAAEATDPHYWARHLNQTVRLADGLATLWSDPARILLEVGPGQTLSALALQHPASAGPERVVLPSLPTVYERQPDQAVLLTSLGKLWLAGSAVARAGFYAHERRQRRPVPTYPFEHQRYWVDPPELVHRSGNGPTAGDQPASPDGPHTGYGAIHPRPNLLNDYVAPSTELEQDLAAIWQEILGLEQVGIHDNFMALGGHSLMATVLVSRLRDTFQVEVPLPRFFEAPTVAQLAEVIEELLIEKIEALPEDEVERLISSVVDHN